MLQSIFHEAAQPSETSPVLIMLHGRGADEHDLFVLKEYLDPHLNIYSLRAPFEFTWGGYAWFELFDDGSVDEKSFAHSKSEILSFLDSLKTKNIYLLGFSMGAIMSYSIALTQPNLCKGIIALSGFAPLQLESEYLLNNLQHLHIFASHGIEDPVIPISSARKTKDLLVKSNANVTYREYHMGHQINEGCLSDISRWISSIL